MKNVNENAQKWVPTIAEATDLIVIVDASELAFFAPPYDVKLRAGAYNVALLIRKSLGLTTIAAAARLQKEHARALPEIDVWLLAVPRMTAALAVAAKGMKVNWIDEDGNAEIHAEGLHVKIRGERANDKAREDRVTLASSVSRRIGRALLAMDVFPVKQTTLATAIKAHNTQVSRGYTELEKAKVIAPGLRGVPPALDRARLLDLLRDDSDADAPIWLEGKLVDRRWPDLAEEIADRLGPDATYAVTGKAAALRQIGKQEAVEPVFVYLTLSCPGPHDLGFEVEEGGPVRICATADVSRLVGAKVIGGVTCVAPSQAYLDLLPGDLQEDLAEEVRQMAIGRHDHNYLTRNRKAK